MTLKRKIELLHNSSERLTESMELPRDEYWWRFMRREAWLHLRRTIELLWLVYRRRE